MSAMAVPLSEVLEGTLNNIKEDTLNTSTCNKILKLLDDGKNVKPQLIQKLLEVCIRDPKNDVKYATETLNIVSVILKKVKEFTSELDMVPSLHNMLHMVKTSVYSSTSEQIKLLYFKTLLMYPDEVYLKLEKDCEVLELFDLYCHQHIPVEIRLQPFNILHKYLKVLPPDKRLQFVKNGINIWLLKLIPAFMIFVTIPDLNIENSLQTLEIVVNELQYIDYFDNPNWLSILQYFHEKQQYPTILKNLLTEGNDIWHRLWVVFIKMFKCQVTKTGTTGSPINFLLPVVETAFKMDVTNRCRAFYCWNALIDNFAIETNEIYIKKRMKLLIIPLYSNNAKQEDTIIAKLNTWWHLICGYKSCLNNFADIIIIPFLHFCFGKPIYSGKPAIVPGLLTNKTKEQCVETFVNILGHHRCDGCVSLPILRDKVLNDKCLMASRKDLIHGLNVSLKIVANNPTRLRKPYKCAWISFIKLICDLHDVNIGRDLFNESLVMLEKLIQENKCAILDEIILNDLILTVFEGDTQMQLLIPLSEQSSPLHKIITIILNSSFDDRCDVDIYKTIEIFKPLTMFILKHCIHTPVLEILLKQLIRNDKSMILWTAMASSIYENRCDISPQILHKMLQWPLKHVDLFTNIKICTPVWLELLNFVHTKVGSLDNDDEIFEVLNDPGIINETNSSFFFAASVLLLIQKIMVEKETEYEKEILLIREISNKIRDINHNSPLFSTFIDIFLVIFNRLTKDINLDIAKQMLKILIIILSLFLPELVKSTEVNEDFLLKLEKVIKSIEDLLKVEAYGPLKLTILNELSEYARCFHHQETLKATLLTALQNLINNMDNNNPSICTIRNIINSLQQDLTPIISSDQCKFSTPSKLGTKMTKKKETSIVKTVVENGEEFVVVKSNWKFNPKKLTDNQKEKLQRKREDIPALYQDLSQSQDDFRLSTWKTDSQDTNTTSITSSRSNDMATNEKVSLILKNMPNTDVVPNILQNILTENNDKINSLPKPIDRINLNTSQIHTPIYREVKPRLALKDRLFFNVRNLIEKSNIHNGEKNVKSSIDNITPCPQTPDTMSVKVSDNVLNSAPSHINTERPSRVKRKPKKFEGMQIISLKKRRHSLGNSEPQNTDSFNDLNKIQDTLEDFESAKKKLNVLDIVPANQETKDTLESSLIEGGVKHEITNDDSSEFVLNIQQANLTQNQKVDNQLKTTDSSVFTEKTSTGMDVEKSFRNSVNNAVINNDDHISNLSETPSRKRKSKKKSPIEKELAIDMVEGHPFLKMQSEKRLTRNKKSESPVISKRKSFSHNLNKSKIKQKNVHQRDKKSKEIPESSLDSQESQDANGSQDIIESSQDSTISMMSVKSSKTVKRIPVVALENMSLRRNINEDDTFLTLNSHSILLHDSIINRVPEETNNDINTSKVVEKYEKELVIPDCENKDDSEFPRNKTAESHVILNLTENMDTEPIKNFSSQDLMVVNDKENAPVAIRLDDTCVDMDTQDIADAATQPLDPNITTKEDTNTPNEDTHTLDADKIHNYTKDSESNIDISVIQTQDDRTRSLTESMLRVTDATHTESTSKASLVDVEQRKQDFLDNTLEISPIKILSPVKENKLPSPETSSDYVVIKLSSPVQSNGDPYEKCNSPEIFTEDKVSPDERDQSPPRDNIHVNTASPKSLTLKKNKPQVRSGGRAAQMLGLCVPAPDRLQTILNSEKSGETEEPKKCSPLNSSARRNLRILYNSTNDNNDTTEENDDNNSFLKFNRYLPAIDSSPTVPILKRKLVDIIDDSTISPASKRKRVSFHDPPVSTTICVKKYIEPSGIRSPQSSAFKRQERQIRPQVSIHLKSQKRLDTVFKLETALTKAVESFSEGDVTPNTTEDTEMSSLEPTPLVEVVKNSELNDVDPICMDLIDCNDPIDNIASDLSSAAMRPLLVQEFAGKIDTVGDLAKMTELEVNRLCIKAPKVQVAKKVLLEYAKINNVANTITPITAAAFSDSSVTETKAVDVEIQADYIRSESAEVQTELLDVLSTYAQTASVSTVDSVTQTVESGSIPTEGILKNLLEKSEVPEPLEEGLDVPSNEQVAKSLPLGTFTNSVQGTDNKQYTKDSIDRLFEKHSRSSENGQSDNATLSFMQDYLTERFCSQDLIIFCSELLRKLYDKNI